MHITSDGLLNLSRVKAEVGYRITALPAPPAIFAAIQKYGRVSDEEMFRVFNMGIGFCVIVPQADVKKVIATARKHGTEALELGETFLDKERKVFIEPKRLVGKDNRFYFYK